MFHSQHNRGFDQKGVLFYCTMMLVKKCLEILESFLCFYLLGAKEMKEAEEINIPAVQKEIVLLEGELNDVRKGMEKSLEQLYLMW